MYNAVMTKLNDHSMTKNNDVGTRLKMLRSKFDLTQFDVAEMCGVTATTISYWEGGSKQPNAMHAIKLADLYRVSVHFLVLGREDSIQHFAGNSPSETLLIKKYQRASDKIKKAIDVLLE